MTSAPEPEETQAQPEASAETSEQSPAEPESPSADAPSEDVAGDEVSHDLDALLEDVKRERDEYLSLAQRAKADFENYRKRASRDAEEAERRGIARLAKDLLPSLDNLERALASSGVGPVDDGQAPSEPISEEVTPQEALLRGLQLVLRELQSGLARAGVEGFDPQGEKFDPQQHEAISAQPGADGVSAGTVIETLERGYRIGDRVLRPARVIVSE